MLSYRTIILNRVRDYVEEFPTNLEIVFENAHNLLTIIRVNPNAVL